MTLKYWLMLLLLFGLIGYGFYTSRKQIELLKSCSLTYKAVVVKKYKNSKKSPNIRYSYSIDNNIYVSNESIDHDDFDYFNIGDTIDIKYSCTDHNVSRINQQ